MFRIGLFLALMHASEGMPWQKAPNYDPQCTVDERAFTGVRVLHERTLHLPSFTSAAKQTLVLECELGLELYRISEVSNATVFDRDLEVPGKLLRMVRQPAYASSMKMRYVPGTVVGAAYESYDHGAQWTAISPLVADHWDRIDHETVGSGLTTTLHVSTSLLRSPDVLEKTYPRVPGWESRIPLNRNKTNVTLTEH